MDIFIQPGLCCGHGRCYTHAPQLIQADEEGFASPRGVLVPVPAALVELAERVVWTCPERAIELREPVAGLEHEGER